MKQNLKNSKNGFKKIYQKSFTVKVGLFKGKFFYKIFKVYKS